MAQDPSQVTLSGPSVWCRTGACIGGARAGAWWGSGPLIGLTDDDVVLDSTDWYTASLDGSR